jgi:two-component sensor histidine kinase
VKTILHSRLPERLAGRLPPLLVEIGVGLIAAGCFLVLRLALVPLAGDRAPYAFVFLGIVVASVVAGWRGGLIALAAGQALTWSMVVGRLAASTPSINERIRGLLTATTSQLIILLIIALYQREVAKGVAERERRLELLDQARRELDHRAKNNYQTVLSLIQLQAAREEDSEAKLALEKIADRISAISSATDHLAIRGEDLATVKLRDHLCELCAQLERALARGEIRVDCDVPDVTASADTAIHLAIIVNELVTNALKHAFADGGRGLVQVRSKMVDGGFEIEVSDDGKGLKGKPSSAGSGLGMKLVETFARHLDANHDVFSSTSGTVHTLRIPALA